MTYTLELTHDDMIVINNALAELPFKVAAPVVSRINEQLVKLKEPD